MDASPIITDSTSAATAIGKAALQYGDFKAIGLCNYTPPGVLERLFEALYISAGLPWWATIASSCLLIRGVLAPFTFNNFRTTAVMRQIQPEVKELMSRYQTAKQMGDQEQSQFYMKQLMDLYALHGVQPAAPLGTALLTAPIFISFFMSLDKMTKLPVESFREGGLWWFQDLTVPDPYYILPITASAIFLSNIHVCCLLFNCTY
jgi:YidC/Oxa1 family membrane protein insertase